jgi:Calpain family cysteine protease
MTDAYSSKNAKSPARSTSKKQKRAPLGLEQLETRMLMAFDVIEDQLNAVTGPAIPTVQSVAVLSGTVVNNLASNVIGLQIAGATITSGQRVLSSSDTVSVKLLRNALGQVPTISWHITSSDTSAIGRVQTNDDVATFQFNRPADYRISATSNQLTFRFIVRVSPVLTSLSVTSGTTRLTSEPLTTTARAVLNVAGLDQIDRNLKLPSSLNWQVQQAPDGASPQFKVQGNKTTISFDRAGSYNFRVSVGTVSTTVRINVAQTLSGISVTPGTGSVELGKSLQFTATGNDQFKQPMKVQPSFQWSATVGAISEQGVYQTGSKIGTVRVTARSGAIQGRANATITKSTSSGESNSNTAIIDSSLKSLVSTFYADSTISREEMVQLLRSVGSDNTVSSTELTDLRYITSTNTLRMPEYVRGLAKNVVTTNAANLRYQGQTAGNLSAGSTGVLLNNLVDKWFMGTDAPQITGNGISYRFAVGSLFPTTPGLDDSKQGMLGDCYFLASLVSIAAKDQLAVRNMFVENNDGTVSVRLYNNGVADYVTVDRKLPSYASGSLAYSGYGRSVSSSSTPLWLALAEKAYAQWNETGKAGRDGTNTYAGIEGGWMGNVNAQALGYASSNFAVNSTNKQNLINALNGNQAVTIGTTSGASAGGLVGSHAYVVTGYNSTTDSFSFYNPWSVQHPTALTWNQMQGQLSYFVVTSPSGSTVNGSRVSGSVEALAQTTVDQHQSRANDQQGTNDKRFETREELSSSTTPIKFNPVGGLSNFTTHVVVDGQSIETTEESPIDGRAQLVDLSLESLV